MLPKIDDKIIVSNMMGIVATVKEIKYLTDEARYLIILDWGEYGTSKVYDSDYNKIWFNLSISN